MAHGIRLLDPLRITGVAVYPPTDPIMSGFIFEIILEEIRAAFKYANGHVIHRVLG
jgi:hypothetical protein